MSKRPPPSILFLIYGGSILLHGALAVGAVLLPKSTSKEAVAIELKEQKKKKEPPKPPPPAPPPPSTAEKPKPPPPPRPQAQAKVAPETKTQAPPPLAMGSDGFADLGGLALGNAEGPGLAVGAPTEAAPVATAATASAAKATVTTHKVEQLAASTADVCVEPVVRPKRRIPVVPKYTMDARKAEIEGVVRVEVTIDENGQVVNARIVSGLGYGLDEAALVAARASTFEPATRCKKPVIGTTILPFRFEQQ